MTQMLRILEQQPVDTTKELLKAQSDVRVYQYTLATEIQRLKTITDTNHILQDDYEKGDQDLVELEKDQQNLLNELNAMEEKFEDLLNTLQIKPSDLVDCSQGLDKEQAKIKVEALSLNLDRQIIPKVEEVKNEFNDMKRECE